jgi:PAS domain S-box-containing protein
MGAQQPNASPTTLRVLLVEDRANDVQVIRDALGRCRGLHVDLLHVGGLAAAADATVASQVDAVLLDLGSLDSMGMETLDRLLAAPNPPAVVVLTEFADDAAALEALSRGAQDSLDRASLTAPHLGRTIRNAVERRRLETALRQATETIGRDRAATLDLLEDQRRSQEALRRSEAHLQTLVNTLPDLVWLKDPQGVYLACNARFESFFGARASEIVGRTDYDFKDRELADFFRAHDAAAVAARTPQVNEEEVPFASDGHREFLETIKTPMFDADGSLVGVLGISRDITRRKRAEETLRQTEEQVRLKLDSILSPDVEVREEELVNLLDIPALQALMDNFSRLSHAVVAVLDTKGTVLLRSGWQDVCTRFHRANPASAENCTESDLALARTVQPGEHVAYHCRNGLWDVVTPLMIGGKHVGNIFTGQFFYDDDAIDEETFAAQADRFGFDRDSYLAAVRRVPRVSRDWVATLMVFLAGFADLVSKSSLSNLKLAKALVQQKRVEDDLRVSEERFRQLVETTYDCVWEVDAEGRYTYVSSRSKSLLGYSPDEVLGRTPFDFMSAAEGVRVKGALADIVLRRQPYSGLENVHRHKDGRDIVLETSAAPVLGPNGELLGYRGMDRDVSERRRIEARLREAQKLEAIGQLAGGVAHDFNNILAAIMLHLGLMEMNPALDPETVESVTELKTEAQRAASLTRQLLMFSRRSVLAVKPLDLNDVTTNLLKMLSRLIREDIRLGFEGASPLPAVEADAGMVEQILVNLVVNAMDAMPKGGRITISTSHVDYSSQDVAANPERRVGRFVCLAVADTGGGMDDDTLRRIFEPFFTTKEAGKGTGLGLATLHGIVAQHKGWVEVESALGQGTAFRVFLPAVAQAATTVTEALPAAPQLGGGESILLVEDDAAVRHTVRETLRRLGYRVYEASNGQDAMNQWQAHGPHVDLLLTDMVMPEGLTGLELAEQLLRVKPSLKVIISSGYSAEISQAGVPDKAGIVYLPKPYNAGTLADVVRGCFPKA